MESDFGGMYKQVKKMKAEPILTFTATNSVPASLATGNKSEEKLLFAVIRKHHQQKKDDPFYSSSSRSILYL